MNHIGMSEIAVLLAIVLSWAVVLRPLWRGGGT
jgi:hypothetical protein